MDGGLTETILKYISLHCPKMKHFALTDSEIEVNLVDISQFVSGCPNMDTFCFTPNKDDEEEEDEIATGICLIYDRLNHRIRVDGVDYDQFEDHLEVLFANITNLTKVELNCFKYVTTNKLIDLIISNNANLFSFQLDGVEVSSSQLNKIVESCANLTVLVITIYQFHFLLEEIATGNQVFNGKDSNITEWIVCTNDEGHLDDPTIYAETFISFLKLLPKLTLFAGVNVEIESSEWKKIRQYLTESNADIVVSVSVFDE